MSPRLVTVGGRSCTSTTKGSRSSSSGKSARAKVLAKNGRKVRADVSAIAMVHHQENRQEWENKRHVRERNQKRAERSKNDAHAAIVIPGKATTAASTAVSPDTARATPAASPPLLAPVKIEGGRCDGTRKRQSLDPKALENRALLTRRTERHHIQRDLNKKLRVSKCINGNGHGEWNSDERNYSDQSVLDPGKREGHFRPPKHYDAVILRKRLTCPSSRRRLDLNDKVRPNRNVLEKIKNRQDNTYCSKRVAQKRLKKPTTILAENKSDEAVSISSSSTYDPPYASHDSPPGQSSPNFIQSSSSSRTSTVSTPTSTSSTILSLTPESTTPGPAQRMPSRPLTSTTHAPLETLKSALEGYDHSRIYLAHVSFLDWRDLPGRRTTDGERIWVVGAADHEGRHRTRLLVTGRHWRPRCLSKVNMVTQPVIYAGGGSGSLTADLFLWWFHREFATTAMAMHPDGAILVAEAADYLPPEIECVTADGLVRLFIVPKDCLEPRIVATELRVRLAAGLLNSVRCHPDFGTRLPIINANSIVNELDDRCKRFTLKEAFAELHRAWLGIRSETFARSWMLMQEHDDIKNGSLSSMGPSLSSRSHCASNYNEDGNLLTELKVLTREAGLEVDDSEIHSWIIDEASEFAKFVTKKEPDDEEANDNYKNKDDESAESFEEEGEVPTAKETVGLLSRVLLWMEREPLDPGLLLAVRSMRETAAVMASKMGLAGTHPSGLPFFCPNGDHLTQPPPAHMGIPPYGALDAGKAAAAAGEYWPPPPHGPPSHPAHWKRLLAAAASTGLTRAPMYPFSTGQYPYPMLSPEMTQVAASWHTPSMYPISPASAGFRSPYPTSLPITSSSLPRLVSDHFSDLYRFSPTGLMPPHPGLSPHAHALASHALVSSAPKADHSTLDHNHRSTIDQKNSTSLSSDNTKSQDTGQQNNQDKKKPHIKKPLNAFMLYMKEMRAKVVAECTLKESAAINQILGRRWHSLSREEQARYYEAARQERHLHQQRYPGWSARDNYGYGSKKKKRKKERSADPTGGNNMKKCRARYGLDQQSQWCKPCRRKKKCIRYMGEGGDGDGDGDGDGEDDHSEDNLGSVGEAGTPEDDESLSSPGGLSALSSLASPSLVLPSPSSLASPCPCPLTPPVPPPPLSNQNPIQGVPMPHRNPVGTNPHDINNPLSVNQLTGQCIKSEVGGATSGPSNPAISVT